MNTLINKLPFQRKMPRRTSNLSRVTRNARRLRRRRLNRAAEERLAHNAKAREQTALRRAKARTDERNQHLRALALRRQEARQQAENMAKQMNVTTCAPFEFIKCETSYIEESSSGSEEMETQCTVHRYLSCEESPPIMTAYDYGSNTLFMPPCVIQSSDAGDFVSSSSSSTVHPQCDSEFSYLVSYIEIKEEVEEINEEVVEM